MSLHAAASALLSSWTVTDPEQVRLRDEYLEHLEAGADAVWRTGRPGHLTASVIIVDPAAEHTLLVLHGKLGLWVQPGGHCEDEDGSLHEAASREAREETGVAGLEVGPWPLRLSRHGAPCGADLHYDVQFPAIAPRGATLHASDESHDVGWFRVGELPDALAGGVRSGVAAAVRAAAEATTVSHRQS